MEKKNFKTIILEIEEHYATLKFNRPKASNAYNEAMGLELLEALHELSDPSIRSVVMMGEGEDFSVGLDPKGLEEQQENVPQILRKSIGYLNQVVCELRRLSKPVVAAVHGKAAGTGFSFCLASDFILASQDSSFSCAYINMGLTPDGGLSYFLTRLVGPQKCSELVMTGKSISARKALEMGIISGIVPPDRLVEEAKNLAIYFASGPTLALGRAKRLIDTSLCHSLEEQLEEERQLLISISSSEDFKEGLRAHLKGDKKPDFKGK